MRPSYSGLVEGLRATNVRPNYTCTHHQAWSKESQPGPLPHQEPPASSISHLWWPWQPTSPVVNRWCILSYCQDRSIDGKASSLNFGLSFFFFQSCTHWHTCPPTWQAFFKYFYPPMSDDVTYNGYIGMHQLPVVLDLQVTSCYHSYALLDHSYVHQKPF